MINLFVNSFLSFVNTICRVIHGEIKCSEGEMIGKPLVECERLYEGGRDEGLYAGVHDIHRANHLERYRTSRTKLDDRAVKILSKECS